MFEKWSIFDEVMAYVKICHFSDHPVYMIVQQNTYIELL